MDANALLRFLRLLRFPGLELGPFGATFLLFFTMASNSFCCSGLSKARISAWVF